MAASDVNYQNTGAVAWQDTGAVTWFPQAIVAVEQEAVNTTIKNITARQTIGSLTEARTFKNLGPRRTIVQL